jgi:hypothetical protein
VQALHGLVLKYPQIQRQSAIAARVRAHKPIHLQSIGQTDVALRMNLNREL